MIKKINIGWISLIVILFASYYIFGITGLRTIGGLILLFFLPVYLILDNFNIEKDEKIFFSLFIGIGIFPVIVFYLNRIIPSLRITLATAVIILSGIGISTRRYKKIRK